MRKLILGACALLLAAPAFAQNSERKYATLLYAYDLDGEPADDDQVVEGPDALADSTTYTLDAQPDSCRLLDITVADANSSVSAGAITVAGTGCLGEPRSCSFTFAAGGTGVKTLTCTDGEGAYFKTVSSVTTGALTGEGAGDTVEVGYSATNSVNGWSMWGVLLPPGPNGENAVDPFGSISIALPITTSGSATTTVTSVSSNGAFTNVAVGDLLLIPVQGKVYERKVTARASANSITVNKAVTIAAAGVPFKYKKAWQSTNPADEVVIPVAGYKNVTFDWSVDANANTGGVITLLECSDQRGPDFPTTVWTQVNTTTVASAATQSSTIESIDLEELPFAYCRFGLRFGTGDDTDAAAEDINLSVVLTK